MSGAPGERGSSPFDRATLRFPDRPLERAFLDHFLETVRVSIRSAHVLGIALWVIWGFVVRRFLVADRGVDLEVRYLVLIPIAVAGAGVDLPTELAPVLPGRGDGCDRPHWARPIGNDDPAGHPVASLDV